MLATALTILKKQVKVLDKKVYHEKRDCDILYSTTAECVNLKPKTPMTDTIHNAFVRRRFLCEDAAPPRAGVFRYLAGEVPGPQPHQPLLGQSVAILTRHVGVSLPD